LEATQPKIGGMKMAIDLLSSKIIGIQILGVLFGLFMIYLTFLHRKRGEFTVKEGGAWILMWLGFIFFVLFPKIVDIYITKKLHFVRAFDFFVVLGFIVIFGIVFYMYGIVRINQNQMQEIVRKLAIKGLEKKKK
jgi:hypothetical protein